MNFNSILFSVKVVILSIVLTLMSPLICLCLPILILRYVASIFKRLLRPNLGKLLSARSCLFTVDKMKINPKCSIVSYIVLGGEVTLESYRKRFELRILRSDSSDGVPLHPEFVSFPSRYMGFPVWEPEANFRLEEHIKDYNGPVKIDSCSETEIMQIVLELTQKPFSAGKSPWEMFLLPKNVMENGVSVQHTVIFFRVHHCVGDGYSLARFCGTLGNADEEQFTHPRPNYPKRSISAACFYTLTFPFRAIYDLAYSVVQHTEHSKGWLVAGSQLVDKIGVGYTSPIPMKYVKAIRDHHGASTTCIIIAAIAGAMRKMMLDSGKPIPNAIAMLTALPVPGHPNKMRNHMTGVFLTLPVGTEDPVKRLHQIEHELKTQRGSTAPATFFVLSRLGGCCYPRLLRLLLKIGGVPMIFTNFPGSNESQFLELPILDSYFLAGLPPGVGMGVMSGSSNGNLRISMSINEAILTDAEAHVKVFSDYILPELDTLSNIGGGV